MADEFSTPDPDKYCLPNDVIVSYNLFPTTELSASVTVKHSHSGSEYDEDSVVSFVTYDEEELEAHIAELREAMAISKENGASYRLRREAAQKPSAL
jgi:hypothetical protein